MSGVGSLVDRWQRFWFAPEPTTTLAVVRVAVGLVALGWALTLAFDLSTFYGPDGLLPAQPSIELWFDPLSVWTGTTAVYVLWAVLVASAVAMTVGFRTRIATVVAYLGLLTFQHRNPYVLNSGDLLVRHIVLFLALAPAGAALSLDRRRVARRTGEDPWAAPARAPWALRLLQVQVSVLYLSSVWAKAPGRTWNDGTALSYALRLDDLTRFPVPHAVVHSVLAVNVATYAVLAVELAVGLLVWNRRARPWVLGAGVLLHVGIDLTIMVGFFSYALLAAYLAFVPPDTMARWVDRVRRRIGRPAETPPPADAPTDVVVAPPA